MPRVQAGDVALGWREWGHGPTTVLFIHGNLASKDWIELATRWFPQNLHVIGIDWRGCGDSDRPQPKPDYSNYTMQQHANDMLAALDGLGVKFCHLATHSTGGIIATRMLLAQPRRFGRVLALDPVTPYGVTFGAEQITVFRNMMESQAVARVVMATAAASLFVPTSLMPGAVPVYRDNVTETRGFFERLLEQTFSVSEGVWLGTPHNLNLEKQRQELAPHMAKISHEHLILWGEADGWISIADLRDMVKTMPHCRLVTIPGIGHSMNIEQPALYAGYFGGFFGGWDNDR